MVESLNERYRDFPAQEYDRRAELVREELGRQGLDAVILTHAPNVRWLSGYHIALTLQIKWMNVALLFEREPDKGSVLMTATDATGTDVACVDEVRFWDDKSEPPFTGCANPVPVLTNELKRRGLEDKRIGMELGEGMRLDLSQNDVIALREALPRLTMVDFAPALWRLRSIKSELEIARLKKAAEITLEGYREGFEAMREGMTEKELAAIICSRWLELGAGGIGFIGVVSSERAVKYAHVGPSDSPIRQGEIVNVDGGCLVGGYWADVFRMACIGEPKSKEERRLIGWIIKAKNDAIAAIKPGVKCGDVFEVAATTLQEGDYGHVLGDTSIGHGLGLDMHELPTLSQGSEIEIQKNMVFCVEPWTLDYSDWSKGRNFEDMVRVTTDGTELLSPELDDLVIV